MRKLPRLYSLKDDWPAIPSSVDIVSVETHKSAARPHPRSSDIQLCPPMWSNQRPIQFPEVPPMPLGRLFRTAALLSAAVLTACDNASERDAGGAANVIGAAPEPVQIVDFAALGLQGLRSFDVQANGAKVHAAFIADGGDPRQPYIGYLHSEDGGRHWSAPVALAGQFQRPVESKTGNDIQVAASGDNVVLVWQVSGEIPGMGPLFVARSADGGQSWQAGANPTGSDIDQSHHDLAADAAGRFHLVWLDDRDENGYQGVRYARSDDAGLHWQAAQSVDDSSCSCCWNRIAAAPDGKVDILYRDMEPRDMALAQSADTGISWQRAATVGGFGWKFDGCPHNGGSLAYADDASRHALVWTGADQQVGLYHLQSADGGASWSAPHRLGDGMSPFHADLAAGAERLLAVWDALGPSGSKVYLAESADHGANWTPGRLLSAPAASAGFPRIVATGQDWLALWYEQQPGSAKQWRAALIH
ncbi:sialidase family protein [Methylomonas sp. LWB]|uniref:sialidase family protein n=1 Tax=Methylomonas sp. LWB TaxID=1905845 RepID=UPI0020C92EED|nr:sialidase family protein [Methylomonas sp. LWB]